jgi:hypothetical protein
VLTLNQVCGFKFQVFTGSPINPPSRCSQVVIMLVIYMHAYVVFNMFFMVEFYYNNIVIYA